MKVKNAEIWQAGSSKALERLVARIDESDVPIKYSIEVARFLRRFQPEVTLIEQKRNQLISKYGETNEEGQPFIKPSDTNWSRFAREYDDLMALETELGEKIMLPSSLVINVSDLVSLEPFIEMTDV